MKRKIIPKVKKHVEEDIHVANKLIKDDKKLIKGLGSKMKHRARSK